MNTQAISRFGGVLLAGLLLLGLILGSVLLSGADSAMIVSPTTQPVHLPTVTLYPTLALPTATETAVPGVTPSATATPLPGITPTATPTPPAGTACPYPEGWIAYTLQPDDTLVILARIARINVYALMQANCLTTMDLPSGALVYLPVTAFATVTPITCGPPPTWRVVIVQAGDTLFFLSQRYGTTPDAIRQANCLFGDTVYVGQPLYLPPVMVNPPTPTATATPTSLPPTPEPPPPTPEPPTSTPEPPTSTPEPPTPTPEPPTPTPESPTPTPEPPTPTPEPPTPTPESPTPTPESPTPTPEPPTPTPEPPTPTLEVPTEPPPTDEASNSASAPAGRLGR